MGLTIHYKLIAPSGTGPERAHEFVSQLRRCAQGFEQRGRVGAVHPLGDDEESLRWARQWVFRREPNYSLSEYAEVLPLEGFIFPVSVGADCEPLWLGLCRYPLTVMIGGRRFRSELRGWRLHGFCKTQYASLHGWNYFRRCHTAVIDLLAAGRRMGMEIEINDEGEYWPGRDVRALRQNLDEMNGLVAGAAGALKDFCSDTGKPRVESPIFAHRDFERLEAEGAEQTGKALKAIIREL
jgi:hypothetical protein